MPRIHILDSALADQIAAGEVVERPASVIKELLENALDAGARNITVEVSEGGKSLMRVTDDGGGMDRDDAALCVLRHATSKIRAQADLEAIRTLGFRGEALPSIASVSRFRLLTRTRDNIEGTEVVLEAGRPPQASPAGCAVGTTVEVRDLFFNVPARKKFLKSSAAESAQIGEVCTRAALPDPGLRLVLLRDGRRVKEFLPAQDWAERARMLLGGKLVQIEGERRGVQVRAVLGAPEDARSGATALHVFVNGRPVRERQLARSVAYAYGSVMPPGRYPVGVVHLFLDPAEVDVNVHPQKAEVRFQRGREIMDVLTHVLAQGLGTSAWKGPAARGADYWRGRLPEGPSTYEAAPAPTPAEEDPWGLAGVAPHPAPLPEGEAEKWGEPRPAEQRTGGSAVFRAPEADDPRARSLPLAYAIEAAGSVAWARDGDPAGAFRLTGPQGSGLRALAQCKRLYIVCEGPRGLCILDQHAADERVHYDRLRRQHAAGEVKQQRLLLPVQVPLSEREAALVEAHADEISRAGIEASLLGPNTAAVHAVPTLLSRVSPERLLRDLLNELTRAGDRAFGDAIDMALATMACHGAIRAGDPLSLPECQALLDALSQIDEFGGHCPHGRPIVFEIPYEVLARKVGR